MTKASQPNKTIKMRLAQRVLGWTISHVRYERVMQATPAIRVLALAATIGAASLVWDGGASTSRAQEPAGAAAEDVESTAEDPAEDPIVRPPRVRRVYTTPELSATTEVEEKVGSLIAEVLVPEVTFDLDLDQSKLIRTKRPVSRFSITDPSIVDVVQFEPMEFEFVGLQPGHTTLTLWFEEPGEEPTVLRYLVRVAEVEPVDLDREEYADLEEHINEMFPNSRIQLVPLLDKLIARGQARDSEEAARILAVLSGESTSQTGQVTRAGGVRLGPAATIPGDEDVQARNLINLIEVPGVKQIMLKVRVAEITRSALRGMGVDFQYTRGEFSFSSLLGIGGVASAVLETDDVLLALDAVSSNAYSKVLAEPNLVTVNGEPATFLAGGQFAVPTAVGVDGVGAVTTSFQSFGTQLTFTPTIIDKDRIHLRVVPSFSTVNNQNSVNGIPGLNTRTVSTTVDLREGQWLAIAGLLQDLQSGTKQRVPVLGDVPFLGTLFSSRTVDREESELIILVSPELIRPMEAEEAPLILPGMEVTEPTNCDFYLYGRYEGRPDCHHRSTVWPIQKDHVFDAYVDSHFDSQRQVKCQAGYQQSQRSYIYGPHGFSGTSR